MTKLYHMFNMMQCYSSTFQSPCWFRFCLAPSAVCETLWFCLNSFWICFAVHWTMAQYYFSFVIVFSEKVKWQMLTVKCRPNVSDHYCYAFGDIMQLVLIIVQLTTGLSDHPYCAVYFDYMPASPAPFFPIWMLQTAPATECQLFSLLQLVFFSFTQSDSGGFSLLRLPGPPAPS